jgi:hypothetical protein
MNLRMKSGAARRLWAMSLSVVVLTTLAACAAWPKKAPVAGSGASAPASAASSVSASTSAPLSASSLSAADAALADGLKLYQAGQYKQSESQLKAALQSGLKVTSDVVNANKHLAFIYCMTRREAQCAAAFKAAKAADPNFALSKTEAGHPMWAKTYKKALGLK